MPYGVTMIFGIHWVLLTKVASLLFGWWIGLANFPQMYGIWC